MSIDSETESYLNECRLVLPESSPDITLVHGFDGYGDRVRTMVNTRESQTQYERMDSLETLGERINNSAELENSCSIEWVNEDTRAGGHTSHLGRAFDKLGFESKLIGTYGSPPESVFTDELSGCTMHSVGEPSYTDAVEFDDGRLMLNEIGTMASLDWDGLCERISVETLATELKGAAALSMGYWSTMPFLPSIWRGLCEELWPMLTDPPEQVFVDPADVRRISTNQLQGGIDALSQLDDTVPVTISANRVETGVLSDLGDETQTDLEDQARQAREVLGVTTFVSHTVDHAILVDDSGSARARTPRVSKPALTTSAGDHFNTGFLLGQVLGLDGGPSVVLGNAVANWFVRNGTPPAYNNLLSFLSRFDTYFK